MRKTVPVLLAMMLAFSFLLVAPSSRGSSHWSREVADGSSSCGAYSSLTLDASGNPHMSYFCGGAGLEGNLKYARWDGTAWRVEFVDTRHTGLYTSLALDGSGNPHITYMGPGSGENFEANSLRYARWDGTAWNLETVDDPGGRTFREGVTQTSLALDASGNPHIGYYDGTNRVLKYARGTGTEWQITIVDSAGDVGEWASLALDGSGNPHISYYDETNGVLKYARWDGTAWSIEIVDSAEEVGEWTSLALDASGNPHISYLDEENNAIKYARWDGVAWQIEVVDSTGGQGTAIAVDASGDAHIAYKNFEFTVGGRGADIKYARRTSTGWSLEFVDGTNSGEENIGLVLDEAGNPHISYGPVRTGAQKYAVRSGGIFRPDAPRSLSATSGNGQVTLTWSRPSDGGSPITSYRIYSGTTSGSLASLDEVGNVLAYTDTGLTNGVTYYYEVSAVNGVGEGPRSEEVSTAAKTPSAPHNLQATAGDERVNLAWQAPASEGASPISNYRIYRGTASGSLTRLVLIGGVLEHTDTGLTNGVTYYYQVTAVNAAGEGAVSNIVSATPAPDTTSPTISVTSPIEGATLTSTSTTVSGTASDDVALEKVELSTDGTNWVLAAGTTSWSVVLTLAEGENTLFARATDTSGNAATMSIAVTVVTPTPNLLTSPLVITAGGATAVAVAALAALLILRNRGKRKGEG